ncbi:hypothetical protein [Flavobacterium salmonis]|uniref:Uncharacterized protein n=1 Tax=Flavobacterium salmonis TaxID=2654844 RepID=A0A6V6Z4I6_9FLAO|nr:hypothetical protein [Flavobacterium salmonis]CAD0006565.1 hypothetical protein FLAT13_03348 [Flavobacterium salmonis]
MKNLKGVISIIGIVVKYGAVVTAIIKGVQVVADELSKIDFGADEQKKPTESLKSNTNE